LTDHSSRCIVKPVLALVGPTAIGKTALSLELCSRFNCEIVSVDSMQVYRFMDIGTAKATPAERARVPHHLIDIVDPDEAYHAARFVEDCVAAVASIHGRGATPLLTGGTGLYLTAFKTGLFDTPAASPVIREELQRIAGEEGCIALHERLRRLDPEAAIRIHPNHSSRIIRALEVYLSTGKTISEHLRRQAARTDHPEFKRFLTIGLTCERNLLYERINERTHLLFDMGLEHEVRNLLERGYAPDLQSMQSIGYRHMVKYLMGDWSHDRCVELLARDTRRYAKRQLTWFNRDASIQWFDSHASDLVVDCIATYLNHSR